MKIKYVFYMLLPLLLLTVIYADGIKTTSQTSDIKSKTTVNTTCEKPCLQKVNCPHGDTCTCGEVCKSGNACKADSTCQHVKPENCPKKASTKDTSTKKATTAIKCDPTKCGGCTGHK